MALCNSAARRAGIRGGTGEFMSKDKEIPRPAREERNAARRQQVLEAAQDCFLRSGFHGASMAEISAAAGMSVGHIYHYFENKDAIIAAIIEQGVQHLSEDFAEIGRGPDIISAMIDHAGEVVRRQLDGKGPALSAEIFAEASRNPNVRKVLQDADTKVHDIVRETIRRSGNLSDDETRLDARMELIGAIFDGLEMRRIRNPNLPRDAVLAELPRLMRYLLLGRADQDAKV
jgi:AcrR family transcriptional regulator